MNIFNAILSFACGALLILFVMSFGAWVAAHRERLKLREESKILRSATWLFWRHLKRHGCNELLPPPWPDPAEIAEDTLEAADRAVTSTGGQN